MLITASEYSSMGFPAVSGGDVESCIKRSDYIISALTEGRAEKSVEAGGKPAELGKQAAGFQTYILLRENERYEKSSHSGSENHSNSSKDLMNACSQMKNARFYLMPITMGILHLHLIT